MLLLHNCMCCYLKGGEMIKVEDREVENKIIASSVDLVFWNTSSQIDATHPKHKPYSSVATHQYCITNGKEVMN